MRAPQTPLARAMARLFKRDDAPVSDPITIPSRSESAAEVSPNEALTLGAVYRAVSIRVAGLCQLSIDVERAGKTITTPSLLTRPDVDTSYRAFIEQTAVSLSLAGNAYWRITRNDRLEVSSLEVLNPHDVTIRTNAAGRVVGFSHRGADLKTSEIKHLSKLRVPGTPYGLGPIQAARAELRGAIDLRDYASKVSTASDVPTGVLSASMPLTDEEAKATKAAWQESHGGKRGVAVLGSGLTYAATYLTPADAQFLESQRFSVIAIARLFGVPASLMLSGIDGSALTYANISQEWLGFVKFGLADDIAEIEEAFSDLLPRGQRARFNPEALLRLDTTGRYAAHESALRAGWLLPSEVRAIENLPEVSDIDTRVPPARPTEKAAA
ncbi:phage portal protein [Microbacterium murale]|uniref:HK97 family phage portal protein n=1 Tax=Microbacterium murale TaxID=1081040 RepID=A0ABU0PEA8_9MICO|nr:phage portal protein [Microbacterium murale]MDQ0645659.1 HK97 family phage portal protein [Microbacterium murale]